MRHFTFIVFIAVLVARYSSVSALSCRPCERSNCHKEPCTHTCPYGIVKDLCNCCNVCAKGPGEECGGDWDMHGKCGDYQTCVTGAGGDPRKGLCRWLKW